jgi:2-amino-4-hydroxy-6-hydroxymethyldihydropteridine diphosphokinase
MSAAVLSLGSNVGDRLAHLQRAVDALAGVVQRVSPVYETEPWGVAGHDDYLNLILTVASERATPHDWLRRARMCEEAGGRTRGQGSVPRVLDVDVIAVGLVEYHDDDLTLPHPRAHRRAFVLRPWLDVDPVAELPRHGRVDRLLAALPAAERAGVRLVPHTVVVGDAGE